MVWCFMWTLFGNYKVYPYQKMSIAVANHLKAKWFSWNFYPLELCLADVSHKNFKWVDIIQICQNGGQRFWNIVHKLILMLMC